MLSRVRDDLYRAFLHFVSAQSENCFEYTRLFSENSGSWGIRSLVGASTTIFGVNKAKTELYASITPGISQSEYNNSIFTLKGSGKHDWLLQPQKAGYILMIPNAYPLAQLIRHLPKEIPAYVRCKGYYNWRAGIPFETNRASVTVDLPKEALIDGILTAKVLLWGVAAFRPQCSNLPTQIGQCQTVIFSAP